METNYAKQKFKEIFKSLMVIINYMKIFALLAILWYIFSGSNDKFLLTCGAISVLTTFIICIFGKIISSDFYIIKFGFIKYIAILIKNIITSTIQIVKIIYSRKIIINPGTTIVNASRLNDQEKVLFANMITMTPGTFVIAVEGNNFLIHALNKDNLDFDKNNNKKMTELIKKIRS